MKTLELKKQLEEKKSDIETGLQNLANQLYSVRESLNVNLRSLFEDFLFDCIGDFDSISVENEQQISIIRYAAKYQESFLSIGLVKNRESKVSELYLSFSNTTDVTQLDNLYSAGLIAGKIGKKGSDIVSRINDLREFPLIRLYNEEKEKLTAELIDIETVIKAANFELFLSDLRKGIEFFQPIDITSLPTPKYFIKKLVLTNETKALRTLSPIHEVTGSEPEAVTIMGRDFSLSESSFEKLFEIAIKVGYKVELS
jgi:hypothetical protein